MIDKPTKEMKEYALQEMVSLVENMRVRPIQCYSQRERGEGKLFFLGRVFCEELIAALKKQYK